MACLLSTCFESRSLVETIFLRPTALLLPCLKRSTVSGSKLPQTALCRPTQTATGQDKCSIFLPMNTRCLDLSYDDNF